MGEKKENFWKNMSPIFIVLPAALIFLFQNCSHIDETMMYEKQKNQMRYEVQLPK